MAHGELTTLIQVDHGDPSDGLGLLLDPAVKDLEEAVTAYLRRATETFDLSKNVEVCTILCLSILLNCFWHGLRTPREEIAFTAWPKIHCHSQIFK